MPIALYPAAVVEVVSVDQVVEILERMDLTAPIET
jgi:hypothetical protein